MKKPLAVLVSLLVVTNFIQAQPLTIGYTNCIAVTNFPQSVMDQIGQLKWYFAHASIGGCIMEGVTNLHLAAPGFFQWQGFNATNTLPATNPPGTIYQDARGNPDTYGPNDYQLKIAYFAAAVSNGWHYPFVNIALNKFCYIDIWYTTSASGVATELSSYLTSMTNLEAAYPDTVFVYATMPLTVTNTSSDLGSGPLINDYWRNVFNNNLRAWCATNNRPLFDVADIEAHDTNGSPWTASYNSTVFQQLWFANNQGGDQCCGEVGDGCHPTNFGAEARMAQGLYALAAAIMNPSPLLNAISVSNGTASVTWNALPGHFYRLQYKPSPFAGNWTDIQPDVLAQTSTVTVTNAPADADGCFYRVRLVQ